MDREFVGSISTRKLVIETAKFNVVTAYSGAEAVATLERFPAVNGIVLDAGVSDIPLVELCKTLKGIQKGIPIVMVGAPGAPHAEGADHYIDSFDPGEVLKLLKNLKPREAAEVARQDAALDPPSS